MYISNLVEDQANIAAQVQPACTKWKLNDVTVCYVNEHLTVFCMQKSDERIEYLENSS